MICFYTLEFEYNCDIVLKTTIPKVCYNTCTSIPYHFKVRLIFKVTKYIKHKPLCTIVVNSCQTKATMRPKQGNGGI